MISTIHEHKVDLDLLPDNANILDLGCRGYLFSDYFYKKGHKVITLDIDEKVFANSGSVCGHYICAIADYDGYCGIINDRDPQATRMTEGDKIPCYKLETIMGFVGLEMFDLIKSDIEGAEYQMIMSLTKPPAKQLSIEFHLHTGIYGINEMSLMVAKLEALGYEAVSHEMSKQHGLGMNYWDSLFIFKSLRDKCQYCGNDGTDNLHSCSYQSDINEYDEPYCNCCDVCYNNCRENT